MSLEFATAGETVSLRSELGWATSIAAEAVGTAAAEQRLARPPTIRVRLERSREPFHDQSWRVVTRGAWAREGCVVIENVCTSGFDLLFHVEDLPTFRARWRPPRRERAASYLLRSRFHLVTRAALLQYPAMWWAGVRGRVPVHGSLIRSNAAMLLAGPGGVGKSTLLQRAVAAGADVTTDNLGVTDGTQVWGVVEPLRVADGLGRRMPHGRREAHLTDRRDHDTPEIVVAVARQHRGEATSVRGIGCEEAREALVAGTFMAGELNRYWAFAATMSSASGLGRAHPALGESLGRLTAALPCVELRMAHGERRPIGDLLATSLAP